MASFDLYVFPSTCTVHIDLAIRHNKWAVTKRPETEKRKRYRRAEQVIPGDHGIFYDTERHGFTVPFIVGSFVGPEDVIDDPWPGEWELPFTVLPLGRTTKLLPKNDLKRYLPTIRRSNDDWNKILLVGGLTVFSPSSVSIDDWDVLLEHLTP